MNIFVLYIDLHTRAHTHISMYIFKYIHTRFIFTMNVHKLVHA